MFGADAAGLLRRKQRKRADTPSPSSRAQFTWHQRTRDHARTWVHRMVECTREHTLPPDVLRQLGVLAAAMPGEHPHGAVARDALEMGGGGGGEHGMSAEQRLRILDDLVEMLNYFDRVPYQQGTYARSPQQIELHYRLTMAVAKRLMGTHFQRVLPRLRARFPDIEDSNAWICVSAPRRFGKTVALSLFTAAVMLTIPGWNVVLFSTMWQISKMISQRITEVISNAGYAERLRRDNKDELFVQPIGHADLTHLKLPSSNEDRYGHARPRARARARRSGQLWRFIRRHAGLLESEYVGRIVRARCVRGGGKHQRHVCGKDRVSKVVCVMRGGARVVLGLRSGKPLCNHREVKRRKLVRENSIRVHGRSVRSYRACACTIRGRG